MRTTLDIVEDILLAVKELAAARQKTAGKILSELARRGLLTTRPAGESEPKNGFVVFPATDDTVVTVELIDRLLDEDVLTNCDLCSTSTS